MLVGIQGSGKWTQARKILEKFPEMVLFETGWELRKVAKEKSELGLDIKKTLEAWMLVKTEQLKWVLESFIAKNPRKQILLDSAIRNAEQNAEFWSILGKFDVLYFQLDVETGVKRLAWRRMDPITNETFPASFKWDKNPKTGNKLVTRADDTEDAIRKRIAWSISDTLPLLDIWEANWHKIYRIDADQSEDEIFAEVEKVVNK